MKRSAKGRDMRELGSVKTARARELLNQLESPELGIDKIVKMTIGLSFLWALIVYTVTVIGLISVSCHIIFACVNNNRVIVTRIFKFI